MYRDSYSRPYFGFGVSLTPMVKKLLIANVAVFVATSVADAAGWPLSEYLAFRPDRLLAQFWGPLTYMFVHAGLGHILVNMLTLFFFGSPLEERWGGREFLRFYLVSGLGGVALSFVLSPGSAIVGASAACFGLMLAFVMNWPRVPVLVFAIFPVQAWMVVAFLLVTNLFYGFTGEDGGIAYFAHLGGFLAAFLYLKADWRPAHFARKVGERVRPKPRKLVVVPPDEERSRSAAAPPQLSDRDERKMLDEVDRVLDKISAQGMSSLTEEERKLLDEVSRRRRTN